VFVSHGEQGYMVPNQYWVPGMLSPMPMMGKYFVYYGGDFLPPAALGGRNVERMTYELFNENSGICRFHRKWSESLTAEILQAHYGLKVDYKAHQFELARQIFNREQGKSLFWETGRIADMILGFLELWEGVGLMAPELHTWLAAFREDKQSAAQAWWEAVLEGQRAAFEAGADRIPDSFTPGQQGKLPKPGAA